MHEEALQRLSSLLVARDTMLKLQLEKQKQKENEAAAEAVRATCRTLTNRWTAWRLAWAWGRVGWVALIDFIFVCTRGRRLGRKPMRRQRQRRQRGPHCLKRAQKTIACLSRAHPLAHVQLTGECLLRLRLWTAVRTRRCWKTARLTLCINKQLRTKADSILQCVISWWQN